MNRIPIAESVGSHGLKGGVVLRDILGGADKLAPGAEVTLRLKDGRERAIKITRVARGGKLIAWLAGIESIESLEGLLPFTLLAAGEGADPAALPGREVVCARDGRPLGRVDRVYSNGAQWVLEVAGGERNFSIPWVPAFVVESGLPLRVHLPEFVE